MTNNNKNLKYRIKLKNGETMKFFMKSTFNNVLFDQFDNK